MVGIVDFYVICHNNNMSQYINSVNYFIKNIATLRWINVEIDKNNWKSINHKTEQLISFYWKFL